MASRAVRHGAGRLQAGDYALVLDGAVVAVVERKTFDGLLAEFGRMDVLRQRLLELSSYEHHALVIEAPYEDFLNPARVGPRRSVPEPSPTFTRVTRDSGSSSAPIAKSPRPGRATTLAP